MRFILLNILICSICIILGFIYLFSFGGCARGPFEVDTPTPSPTSAVPTSTPTEGPTPIPKSALQIDVELNGSVDQNKGFYIFAFNIPNPLTETEADPISTNSDFWTDYISYGPLGSQDADFIRRARLIEGDITSDWNPTQFIFTTGSISDDTIEILLTLETLGKAEDLYFTFITTDVNGIPRDGLGFGLGSTTDSIRLNQLDPSVPYSYTDALADVKQEGLPDDVNPDILDIRPVTILYTKEDTGE